jgi:hypothetical protein
MAARSLLRIDTLENEGSIDSLLLVLQNELLGIGVGRAADCGVFTEWLLRVASPKLEDE